jgi:hypothetical protein
MNLNNDKSSKNSESNWHCEEQQIPHIKAIIAESKSVNHFQSSGC